MYKDVSNVYATKMCCPIDLMWYIYKETWFEGVSLFKDINIIHKGFYTLLHLFKCVKQEKIDKIIIWTRNSLIISNRFTPWMVK